MLKNLKIIATEDAPYVFMDAEEGYFEIKGKSFPPDVRKFYKPVINWLEDYKNVGEKEMNVNLKLEYFNTSSSKLLLDILYKLEEIDQGGNKVIINWYYPEDDEEILDIGEEYDGLVDLFFRHISYQNEF